MELRIAFAKLALSSDGLALTLLRTDAQVDGNGHGHIPRSFEAGRQVGGAETLVSSAQYECRTGVGVDDLRSNHLSCCAAFCTPARADIN